MADFYWVNGTGNWSDFTNKWRIGGTGGTVPANAPTSADNVFFVDGSAAGTFTVTITAGSTCANFDASGITDAAKRMTLAGSGSLNVAGSWINPAGAFYQGTFSSAVTFSSTTTGNTITTNGVLFSTSGNASITFNGIGGGWTLADALTFSGVNNTVTLTNGALDLGGFTLSTAIFSSNNSNVRSIAFGSTGAIVISGTTGAVWQMATLTNFSYTGTSSVTILSGSFQHGNTAGGTEARAINFTISASASGFSGGSHIRNFTTSPSFAGTIGLTGIFYGDVTIGPLTNIGATTASAIFQGSGAQNITMNGRSADQPLTFLGTGTVTLVDNFTTGATRLITLTSGTLNLNGNTLTGGTFASGGVVARTLAFGTSGAVTLAGSGTTAWNATGSGLTTSGAGTINMTSLGNKTFVGGGYNYAAALNQGGAGQLTITGNNTFQDITNTFGATGSTVITFAAGSVQTVGRFTASGVAGTTLSLISTIPGTRFTLICPFGRNSVNFCIIRDSMVLGGARWLALLANGNVNNGNNIGWIYAEKFARTLLRLRRWMV